MRATLLIALLLAGCADTRDAADAGARPSMDAGTVPPPGTDGGAPPPGTDGGAPPPGTDAGDPPPGTDAGPPAPSITFCVLGCAVDADCTTASPAFDADNYRCDDGRCEYTGCVDDAECRATFSNTSYVCRDPGTGVRTCQQSCDAAADCGSGTPAFDANNYACEGGLCRYVGCRDDAECESSFGAGYGCFDRDPPPTPLPLPVATANCVRRCAGAADCATDSGAFGADNYACDAGACVYRGCNDDAECRTSLSSASYVCR